MNERDITTIIHQLDKLRGLCVKALEEVKEKKKFKLYVKNSMLGIEVKGTLRINNITLWTHLSSKSLEETREIMKLFTISTRRTIANIMEDNKLEFAKGYDFVLNR